MGHRRGSRPLARPGATGPFAAQRRARRAPRRLTAPPLLPAAAPVRASPRIPRRLVKYVESTAEPFADGGKDGSTPNPWRESTVATGGCCAVS